MNLPPFGSADQVPCPTAKTKANIAPISANGSGCGDSRPAMRSTVVRSLIVLGWWATAMPRSNTEVNRQSCSRPAAFHRHLSTSICNKLTEVLVSRRIFQARYSFDLLIFHYSSRGAVCISSLFESVKAHGQQAKGPGRRNWRSFFTGIPVGFRGQIPETVTAGNAVESYSRALSTFITTNCRRPG